MYMSQKIIQHKVGANNVNEHKNIICQKTQEINFYFSGGNNFEA